MTDRSENLASEGLISLISGVERDLADIKRNQRVGGASLRFYVNTSPASTPVGDYGLQDVLVPASSSAAAVVKFTATQADWVFADLSYQVFLAGVEIFPGSTNYPGIFVSRRLLTTPQPKETWWALTINNPSASDKTYRIRFYVQSSSTGDFNP